MSTIVWIVLFGLWLNPLAETTQPQVNIVGVGADKTLQLETSVADFEAVVTLEETAGQPVDDLRATFSPLLGALPGQIALTWSIAGVERPAQVKLAKLDLLEVRIAARLPEAGDYRGTISLRYADKRETYTLIVKRRAPIAGLALSALPVGPVELNPLMSNTLAIRLTIAETAGHSGVTYRPVISEFAQLTAENAVLAQASIGGVTLLDEAGAPLVGGASDTLAFAPYQAQSLTLNLQKPLDPGRYRATIDVRTPDGPSIQTQVVLVIRHHWLGALLLILAGTFGSHYLRTWFSTGRTTLVSSMQLARLREELDAQLELKDEPLAVKLRAEVDQARRDQDVGLSVDLSAVVQSVRKRWPLVVEVHNLEQTATKLPADLAKSVTDQLAAARKALDSAEAEQIPAADTALKAARAALTEAARAARVRPIEQLRKTLGIYLADAAWSNVKDDLLAADKQAEAALKASDDVTADSQYAEARRLYTQALLATMQTQLPQAAPLGVPSNDWVTLRQQTVDRLQQLADQLAGPTPDFDTIEAGYLAAMRNLLQSVLPLTAKDIVAWQSKLLALTNSTDASHLTTEQAQPAQTALTAAAEATQTAQDQLKRGEVLAALTSFGIVSQQQQALRAALKTASVSMGAAATAGVLSLAPLAGDRQLAAVTPVPDQAGPLELPNVAQLRAQLDRNDLIATIIVSILAGLVGLQLLWVSNSTFGSLGDYIGALTWGFGLHQLNDATRQAGGPSVTNLLRNPQQPQV